MRDHNRRWKRPRRRTAVNILVACERSGIVRDAFISRGHNAVSCDIVPSETDGPHIQDDVLNHLDDGWDMMLAFPPCTHLSVSGARWFPQKRADGRQQRAVEFFLALVKAPIKKKVIENPIGIMSTIYRKPDQIIQPWMFGHPETKAMCLWRFSLPPLEPTNIVEGREHRIHKMAPSPTRGIDRSRMYRGIASAFAAQYGFQTN